MQEADTKARKLVKAFLDLQGGHPVAPAGIFELLSGDLIGVRRDQVEGTVKRILCGIQWLDEDGWVSIFLLIATLLIIC